MEKYIGVVFWAIPYNVDSEGVSIEEKMKKIAQALEQYKDQIKELEEHAVPTTPPKVLAQCEQDAKNSIENIVCATQRITKLLENNAQLWTQQLEDVILQELQGK